MHDCEICGKRFVTKKGKAIHNGMAHSASSIFHEQPRKKSKYVRCKHCLKFYSRQYFHSSNHAISCEGKDVYNGSPRMQVQEKQSGQLSLADDLANLYNVVPTLYTTNCTNDGSTMDDKIIPNVGATLDSDDEILFDFEGMDGGVEMTDDEAAHQLEVPIDDVKGMSRYILARKEVEARNRDWSNLLPKEHASVVFWAAAQKGHQ
jgi:hypothetical protein